MQARLLTAFVVVVVVVVGMVVVTGCCLLLSSSVLLLLLFCCLLLAETLSSKSCLHSSFARCATLRLVEACLKVKLISAGGGEGHLYLKPHVVKVCSSEPSWLRGVRSAKLVFGVIPLGKAGAS